MVKWFLSCAYPANRRKRLRFGFSKTSSTSQALVFIRIHTMNDTRCWNIHGKRITMTAGIPSLSYLTSNTDETEEAMHNTSRTQRWVLSKIYRTLKNKEHNKIETKTELKRTAWHDIVSPGLRNNFIYISASNLCVITARAGREKASRPCLLRVIIVLLCVFVFGCSLLRAHLMESHVFLMSKFPRCFFLQQQKIIPSE